MKVLLISSFTETSVSRVDIAPPLSLLYLSSVLREAGHDPVLLDLTPLEVPGNRDPEDFYLERITDVVRSGRPELVGQNCFLSTHFTFVRKVARAVKKIMPQTPFVTGGIHPTLFAEDIIAHCPEIDYIVMGEGEEQARMLADYVSGNGSDENREAIPSLAFRNAAGKASLSKRVSYIHELDSIPMPAWDLVRIEDYYTDHSNWYNPKGLDIKMSVPILTSRSCPFDCNFCSAHAMMGRRLRRHSPERVVREIETLYSRYGQNYFGFVDDNLTLNKRHVLSICDGIVRRGLNIQFESFNGYNISSMDEEIVEAMCAAGCIYAIMPIEHGSDFMRNKIIGKKLPREKIYRLAEIYRKHNVLTRGVFIMGFPEETKESLDETYRMMQELDLDLYNVFTLIPFPGTRVFDQAAKDNLLIEDVDAGRLWEGNLQLNALQDQVFIQPYGMTVEELSGYRKKFDAMRLNSTRAISLQKGCGK